MKGEFLSRPGLSQPAGTPNRKAPAGSQRRHQHPVRWAERAWFGHSSAVSSGQDRIQVWSIQSRERIDGTRRGTESGTEIKWQARWTPTRSRTTEGFWQKTDGRDEGGDVLRTRREVGSTRGAARCEHENNSKKDSRGAAHVVRGSSRKFGD